MKRTVITSLVGLILLSLIASCGKNGEATKKGAGEQLKTYKVSTSDVQAYIEATGSVQPDLQGSAKIVAHLAGMVARIFVKAGDSVRKGDPLLAVTSPEMTDTHTGYASALTQMKQAERVYNLNKQLFEIGAVTKNELLISQANYEQLKAVSEGLKNKLSIYGSRPDNGSGEDRREQLDAQTIRSPMNGTIADIVTHVGDKVDTSIPLMVVADPKNIVIVANIYDTDIPKVKKGSHVTFYADVYPDRPFHGVIAYVSDISDPDLKTVKTFIRIIEQDHLFKQNMFLKMKIEGEKKRLSIIPQTAMVYKDGKFYIYCVSPDKERTCRLREIRPVKEVPGKLMAVEGVESGEEIVLSAIGMERP